MRAASGACERSRSSKGGLEEIVPWDGLRPVYAFGRKQADAELVELGVVDRRRRAGERIEARLRLGEGDDLTDVLLAGEEGDEPVDAEREAGVRRRAVAEGVEQEAEPTPAPPRRRCP